MTSVIVQGVAGIEAAVSAADAWIEKLKRTGRIDHPGAGGSKNWKGRDPVGDRARAEQNAEAEARALDNLSRAWTNSASNLRALLALTDRFMEARGTHAVDQKALAKLREADQVIRHLFPPQEDTTRWVPNPDAVRSPVVRR